MRAVLVILCLAITAGHAQAERCTIDRKRYDHMTPEGWGEALLCGGEKVWGVTIRYSGNHITGVSWAEHQGKRHRNIYLYDDGTMVFLARDERVNSKSFFKQTRGTKYYAFPRAGRLAIAKDGDQLLVRDMTGRTWVLAGTALASKYVPSVSWTVESIDGVAQKPVAIGFTVKGIVGLDFVKAKTFFLETRQPDLGGLADRRSAKFRETKSVFHDGRGGMCAVANEQLFGGRAADPNDKAEYELLFPTDQALDEFLEQACPKLDRSALGTALEQ